MIMLCDPLFRYIRARHIWLARTQALPLREAQICPLVSVKKLVPETGGVCGGKYGAPTYTGLTLVSTHRKPMGGVMAGALALGGVA